MGEFGIVGDPAGMRALASDLVSKASQLREIRSKMRKRWSNVEFAGPFATTVNGVLRDQWSSWDTAADQLDAAAKTLRSSATKVETEIEAERQRRKWIAYQQALEEERRRREAET